jgi:hypothetical protein
MKISEETSALLLKNARQKLTEAELKTLLQNFSSDEIDRLTDAILTLQEEIEFRSKLDLKSKLTARFTEHKNSKINSLNIKSRFNPIRAAATILLLIGVGAAYFILNSIKNSKNLAAVEQTMKTMKVNLEESASEPETTNPPLKEETKYLMTMDFFSNAGLGRD